MADIIGIKDDKKVLIRENIKMKNQLNIVNSEYENIKRIYNSLLDEYLDLQFEENFDKVLMIQDEVGELKSINSKLEAQLVSLKDDYLEIKAKGKEKNVNELINSNMELETLVKELNSLKEIMKTKEELLDEKENLLTKTYYEKEELIEENNAIERLLGNSNEEKIELENKIAEFMLELEKTKEELNLVKADTSLQDEISFKAMEIEEKSEEINKIKEEKEKLESDILEFREELEKTKEELNLVKADTSLQDEISFKAMEIEEKSEEINKIKEEKEKLESDILGVREELEKTKEELNLVKADTSLQDEVSFKAMEIEEKAEEINKIKEEKEKLEADILEFREELEKTKEELNLVKADTSLQDEINLKNQEIQEKTEKLNESNDYINALQNEVEDVLMEIKTAETTIEKLKMTEEENVKKDLIIEELRIKEEASIQKDMNIEELNAYKFKLQQELEEKNQIILDLSKEKEEFERNQEIIENELVYKTNELNDYKLMNEELFGKTQNLEKNIESLSVENNNLEISGQELFNKAQNLEEQFLLSEENKVNLELKTQEIVKTLSGIEKKYVRVVHEQYNLRLMNTRVISGLLEENKNLNDIVKKKLRLTEEINEFDDIKPLIIGSYSEELGEDTTSIEASNIEYLFDEEESEEQIEIVEGLISEEDLEKTVEDVVYLSENDEIETIEGLISEEELEDMAEEEFEAVKESFWANSIEKVPDGTEASTHGYFEEKRVNISKLFEESNAKKAPKGPCVLQNMIEGLAERKEFMPHLAVETEELAIDEEIFETIGKVALSNNSLEKPGETVSLELTKEELAALTMSIDLDDTDETDEMDEPLEENDIIFDNKMLNKGENCKFIKNSELFSEEKVEEFTEYLKFMLPLKIESNAELLEKEVLEYMVSLAFYSYSNGDFWDLLLDKIEVKNEEKDEYKKYLRMELDSILKTHNYYQLKDGKGERVGASIVMQAMIPLKNFTQYFETIKGIYMLDLNGLVDEKRFAEILKRKIADENVNNSIAAVNYLKKSGNLDVLIEYSFELLKELDSVNKGLISRNLELNLELKLKIKEMCEKTLTSKKNRFSMDSFYTIFNKPKDDKSDVLHK